MEYRIQQKFSHLQAVPVSRNRREWGERAPPVWKLGRGRRVPRFPARQWQSLLLFRARIKPQRLLPSLRLQQQKLIKHREEQEHRNADDSVEQFRWSKGKCCWWCPSNQRAEEKMLAVTGEVASHLNRRDEGLMLKTIKKDRGNADDRQQEKPRERWWQWLTMEEGWWGWRPIKGRERDGGFGSERKVTGERKASVRKRKIEEIS